MTNEVEFGFFCGLSDHWPVIEPRSIYREKIFHTGFFLRPYPMTGQSSNLSPREGV